jgi:hypothetical protein
LIIDEEGATFRLVFERLPKEESGKDVPSLQLYKASGLAESPARDNHLPKTDMVRGLTSF